MPCLLLTSHCHCIAAIALEPALLFAILVQLIAEFGMGDLDKRLGALPHGASMQIRDPVFGDYVVHVASAGEHTRSLRQARHNARDGVILRGRGQSDDWLA